MPARQFNLGLQIDSPSPRPDEDISLEKLNVSPEEKSSGVTFKSMSALPSSLCRAPCVPTCVRPPLLSRAVSKSTRMMCSDLEQSSRSLEPEVVRCSFPCAFQSSCADTPFNHQSLSGTAQMLPHTHVSEHSPCQQPRTDYIRATPVKTPQQFHGSVTLEPASDECVAAEISARDKIGKRCKVRERRPGDRQGWDWYDCDVLDFCPKRRQYKIHIVRTIGSTACPGPEWRTLSEADFQMSRDQSTRSRRPPPRTDGSLGAAVGGGGYARKSKPSLSRSRGRSRNRGRGRGRGRISDKSRSKYKGAGNTRSDCARQNDSSPEISARMYVSGVYNSVNVSVMQPSGSSVVGAQSSLSDDFETAGTGPTSGTKRKAASPPSRSVRAKTAHAPTSAFTRTSTAPQPSSTGNICSEDSAYSSARTAKPKMPRAPSSADFADTAPITCMLSDVSSVSAPAPPLPPAADAAMPPTRAPAKKKSSKTKADTVTKQQLNRTAKPKKPRATMTTKSPPKPNAKDYGCAETCPGCAGKRKAHVCGRARSRRVTLTI
eukprot:COSAG01_NODE_2742_length_7152_cov_9.268538_9_plen_544_part_01